MTTMAACALAALAVNAAPARAQATTMSPQEQANLTLVSDWWREVLQAGHTELAEKYMAESYIEHNPNMSTGRAAFVAMSGRRPPRDIKASFDPAPVIRFAKGSYVVFVWEREAKDQMGSTYRYNFFDLVRVDNGKVAEHWASAFRTPTNPNQPAPAAAVVPGIGPKPVKPANTPEEQKNEDIADVEFKDILQYGHVELAEEVMAPGYIQHNPNVPNGRDGFVKFFSQVRKREPIKKEWKDEPELVVTSGNLVLYMMKRFATDFADRAKVYKWNWFDMVRVDNGMIQEHWDMATKPGSQPQAPISVPRPVGFKEYR